MTGSTLSNAIRDGYRPVEECESLSESPWLKQFADGVAESKTTTEAWRTLEGRCNMSYVTELLYLYTADHITLPELNRDRHRFLVGKLETIVLACDDLIHALEDFAKSPEAARTLLPLDFAADRNCILAARTHADMAHKYAKAEGSRKTDPKEWFLHSLACVMESATGTRSLETLSDLITVANQAQGNKEDSVVEDANSLNRRIQRFRKRTRTLPPLPSTMNSRFSFRDFLAEIKPLVKDR
jgi:hypothetical protein